MNENLTLWRRIIADTPVFFKRIQVFAVGLAGLGGTLATIQGIPTNLSTALISAGTAIAVIAQFAVKLDKPGDIPPANKPEQNAINKTYNA